MPPTSRELVYQALNFENPIRAPRQLWALPIATRQHPDKMLELQQRFPADITGVGGHCRERGIETGDMYAIGTAVDAWGCEFHNIQAGVIGEVKKPLVKDWCADMSKIHVPREQLSIDVDAVNRDCAKTDQFVTGGCCPRPFEQLQFLRGSQALYEDLADPPKPLLDFLKTMHDFYCELLETWTKTDVDAVNVMDDWGSQTSLLISPRMWRQIFKPLYQDYCQIAHAAGKKIFFHSDGYILSIYPDLIEIGVDALNSQLFCMGVEKLAPYAGQITFWGEIDRQYLLSRGTPEEVESAVRSVHAHLWKNGGCIAQMEFGPGANPDNVLKAFETWNTVFEPVPAA
ncbi:MAG TPA: uroporphyrinogen decarboxylase family protein [Planctomycetota bacterium]|nr:uroporphyrinogen decarboxylase family protein [Planctomycetota bacterium]